MKAAVIGTESLKGRRVARDLQEAGLETIAIDPGQSAAGFDVIVSSLEGFPEKEITSAEAAGSHGVPFVSGNSDPDSAEALIAFAQSRQPTDAPVVIGCGWSPGLSGILARLGAGELDEVRRVKVSWVVSTSGPDRNRALARAMLSLSGSAVTFENGAWTRRQAGHEGEEVFFPEPIGWKAVHIARALDPLTLPGAFPAAERVVVKGGISEPLVGRLVRRIASRVTLSSRGSIERTSGAYGQLIRAAQGFGQSSHSWSGVRVDVTGTTGDATRTISLAVVDQLSNLDSIPLVVSAILAARGEIVGSGTLDSRVTPESFVPGLTQRGLRVARLDRRDS